MYLVENMLTEDSGAPSADSMILSAYWTSV